MHKLKLQEQEATKALLQRIFPEIKISEKSYDQWMKVFEEQVNIALYKTKNDSQSEDIRLELEKTNKNLLAMVHHYKQIINDTVFIDEIKTIFYKNVKVFFIIKLLC